MNSKLAPLIDQLPETDGDLAELKFLKRGQKHDLTRVAALLEKLRQPTNAVARFLWDQFPAKTKKALADRQSTPEEKGPALAQALDAIVAATAIYDPQRFAGISLAKETRELLAQNAAGGARLRLNRLLLQDAFPDEIRRLKSDRLGRESKFTGPEPAAARALVQQVLAGGRPAVRDLIGLIRDPGDPEFRSYKAEYLLHLVVIEVGRPAQAAQRQMVIQAIGAELSSGKHSTAVRGSLIRELQQLGDDSAVRILGGLLLNESLCDAAAAALLAIGGRAVEQFRAAWPKARGRCRRAMVQNLGALQDAESNAQLLRAVRDADPDVRLAAAWAAAKIGDPASVGPLLRAADAASAWERIKVTQACLVLAEALAAAGKKTEATRIYSHFYKTRTRPNEQYLRDAAKQALEELGTFTTA